MSGRPAAVAAAGAACENTVRRRTLPLNGGAFGLGYHLAGPALSLALEGRAPFGDRLRLAVAAE